MDVDPPHRTCSGAGAFSARGRRLVAWPVPVTSPTRKATVTPRRTLAVPVGGGPCGYLLAAAAILALCGPLAGTTAAAPIVAGFERVGRGATDDVDRVDAGLLLLGELGCVNCHAAPAGAAAHLAAKQAPILDKVGERLAPEWIRAYLADPHGVQPGTTMPDPFAALPAAERERAATAVTHFLAGTGGFDEGAVPDAEKAQPKAGEGIFARAGCAACHGGRGGRAEPLADQRPLVGIDRKWSPRALDAFLKNPLAVRPSGRMPAVPLKDQDRRHVVAALLGPLSGGAAPRPDGAAAFTGRAWHAAVERLPDVATLGPPVKSGPVTGFDVVGFAGVRDNFVVELRGFLHASRPGRYSFLITSDDGARLFVGDRLVVEHDGIHPETTRDGEIDLPAGVHPLRIDYFEAGGGEALDVEVIPPRGPRRSALAVVTPAADGTPLDPLPTAADEAGFVVDPALAAEGRGTFLAAGCVRCHQLTGPDRKRLVAADAPAGAAAALRPLADLAALDGGCLAAGPLPGVPHHGLDDAQRLAIRTAIAWLRSTAAAAAPDRGRAVHRTFAAFNCYACHVRDGRGGVLPPPGSVDDDGEPLLKDPRRDVLFTSAVAEMGDEGRLPPTLDGVGDKLAPEFLREVLAKGGADRTATMHTLMPRWPAAMVEPLAARLEGDVATSVPVPALAGLTATDVHEQARQLTGSKGLGCIKCHSFAGEKGQGLGVIDMTRMPRRLRHEWFLAYVLDPQRFRPGTRMPAAWPEGKAFFPQAVDGTATGQIEAVWRYLAAEKPTPPLGSGANPIELVPAARPIIYRNFITGAGPRAIAVGYPEKVSVAFDADGLRLALAWRGAFIDAGRHWTGRGQGFQPPLGDRVFTPDAATPLARFASAAALAAEPWPAGSARQADGPAEAHRFTGYRLDPEGRPTFSWRWGDSAVEDLVVPSSDGTRLVRSLTVTGPRPEGVAAVRIAVGRRIVDAGEGWHTVDDLWRIRLGGPAGAGGRGPRGDVVRREADGLVELRVPLDWQPATGPAAAGDGAARPGDVRAVVEEELSW